KTRQLLKLCNLSQLSCSDSNSSTPFSSVNCLNPINRSDFRFLRPCRSST
ncbi:hypothetical protein LINPERPRIM_LOCUS13684, partial [Linum perenne]